MHAITPFVHLLITTSMSVFDNSCLFLLISLNIIFSSSLLFAFIVLSEIVFCKSAKNSLYLSYSGILAIPPQNYIGPFLIGHLHLILLDSIFLYYNTSVQKKFFVTRLICLQITLSRKIFLPSHKVSKGYFVIQQCFNEACRKQGLLLAYAS